MTELSSLTLEVTTHCQANCVVCVRDKLNFKLGSMTQELFEKAVAEFNTLSISHGFGGVKYIDLGGMGEPILDAKLQQKLEWLDKNYPNIRVGITTNGQLLMEKKELLCKYIDIVKISNYGFTKKSFEAVHGGSLKFENVKQDIEEFLQIPLGERPKTLMSFLMLKENEGEEEEWRAYWEGKCEEITIWLPHNWAGYKESHTEQQHEKCRSCGRPGRDFVVRVNGDVSACCWDFNRQLTIGNLSEASFEELYNGEALKRIVKMHQERSFFEFENLCQNCDQLYDRSDALIYTSNKEFKVNEKTNATIVDK